MSKFSKDVDEAQEEFGFSDDFAALILTGEASAVLLQRAYDGYDVSEADIKVVVEALGTVIGHIIVNYDPALQQ